MIFIIPVLILSFTGNAFCQPDTLWTRYFNDGEGGYREECYRLIQTDDGGFLIGGKTYTGEYPAYYVVKTDTDGLEEWSGCYDVSDRHDFLGGITQAQNNQYFIAGGYQQGSWYANILKIDSNGDSLWSISIENGNFNNIISTLDGDILACGDRRTHLVKITTDGDFVWSRNYNFGGDGILLDIIEMQDSGYVAVGQVWPTAAFILKTDCEGEQEFLRFFDIEEVEDWFNCIIEVELGGYLVGGGSGDDPLLIGFDSNGDTLWVRRGIPDFRERINDLVPAQGGGFVLVGGGRYINNYYDIMRVDDLGEEVWDFNIEFDGSASFNEATSIAALDDGGYLIGGNRFMRFDGGFSAGLIRTEPDTVVLPFELETEADYYDFGDLDVDSTSAWEFEIYNTGRRYAVIDTLWFDGSNTAAFTCPLELPLIINPEDTCLILVSFQPSADTAYSATLVLPYGEDQTLEIALVGNGYINSIHDEPNVLHEFALYEAYPNPFNSTTTIVFGLDKSAPTRMALYDISGREVRTLFDGYSQAGFHSVNLNAGNLSSGLYFVRLDVSGQKLIKKLMLIR